MADLLVDAKRFLPTRFGIVRAVAGIGPGDPVTRQARRSRGIEAAAIKAADIAMQRAISAAATGP